MTPPYLAAEQHSACGTFGYFAICAICCQVRVSPFSANFLLSCSSDWSVRLWSVSRNQTEVGVFVSIEEPSAATDVCWSVTVPFD